MPALTRTRLSVLPALGALLTLLASPSQASMQALDNQALSEVTGQDGVSLSIDLKANIGKISWNDDGGSLSLRNIEVDNGCVSPGDCPDAVLYGPAKLYFSSGLANVPTLKVDVINDAGTQKLQFTLPDLKGTSDQMLADGIIDTPLKIRLRIAGDMYVGESRLGSLVVRDVSNIQGTIRVWGH